MARISVLFTAFKVTVFADGNVSHEKLGETSYTNINFAIKNSLQDGDKVVSCNNCSNFQKSSGVYQLTKNVPARRTAHTKASKAGVVFCEVISVKRANGNFDKYYVFESNALNRLKDNGVLTSFDAESVILAINKQTSGIYFEIPSAAPEATAAQPAAPEATAAQSAAPEATAAQSAAPEATAAEPAAPEATAVQPAAPEATAAQPAAVETYTYPENGITISLDLKKAVPSDVAPDLSNHIDQRARMHWFAVSTENRATIFNLKLKLNLILETYKNGAYEAHQEELASIKLAIPTNRDSALTESLESRMQPEHSVALSPYVDLSHAATLNLEQAKSMYDSAHSSYLDRLDANQGSNNDAAAADVIAAADALDQAEANYDVAQATVNLILNAMSSAAQPAADEATAAQPAATEATAAQPAATEATANQPAAPEATTALTLKQKAALSAIKDVLLTYQDTCKVVDDKAEFYATQGRDLTDLYSDQLTATLLVSEYSFSVISQIVKDANLSSEIEQAVKEGLVFDSKGEEYWERQEKYSEVMAYIDSLLKS